MKVYANDSMDRFGDDLTELILQYMELREKIRLECVSKQWMRCVFQKQFVIEIDFFTGWRQKIWDKRNRQRLSGEHVLESLLKKCPNVIKVCFSPEVKDNVLSIIGQNCPRLKLIVFSSLVNNNYIMTFFRMYGHKIKELNVTENCEELEKILIHCPNLKKLDIHYYTYQFPEDKEFLPKLEDFYIDIESEDVNQLKILSDKYSQTMKILDVRLDCLTEEELKTCIKCIARFENLRKLELTFYPMKTTKPIDDCLSLIGQKCNKLFELVLSIKQEVPITERFFDVFYKFNAIKRLIIELSPNTIINGSVECFKHCEQLIDLDITYPELREDFFANIASFVPKLQFLRISTLKKFSKTFFNSFKHRKHFQKLDYIYTYLGCMSIKSLTFGTYCHKREHYWMNSIEIPITSEVYTDYQNE